MKESKKYVFAAVSCLFLGTSLFAENGDLSSRCSVDWTEYKFNSSVMLDLDKAGIKMPSGKNTAVNEINTELPDLVKEPLLTVYVNNNTSLGDLISDDTINLEELKGIVAAGKKTPAVFVDSSSTIKIDHAIDLRSISTMLVRHRYPYKSPRPVDRSPSRPYTGIIIDARGSLPVHGEFTEDEVQPCFFPQLWDEDMNLIYEKNMTDPELLKTEGMIHFDWRDDSSAYESTVGIDPLHISARKVYGRFRTDPVISVQDSLKILSVPENMELLREGKVVVLLDKENLVKAVAAPEKDEHYYAAIRELKSYLFEPEEPVIVQDTDRGIQILYDLKFVADSPKLLESELPKVKRLAESLLKINVDNSYTILVEGHTADVKKPEGQMKLSIQRTQTIIDELVKNGMDRSIFSYRGYGGTQPIASNDTAEGRAMNRRVIITARPKATYIQRN